MNSGDCEGIAVPASLVAPVMLHNVLLSSFTIYHRVCTKSLYIYIEKYLHHKWLWLCSICHSHNLVISSCMTYHLVRRLTGWVPLVEQELLVFPPEFIPPVFSRIRVTQSLFFCVAFCRSLFVLLPIAFCHLINRFWLLSWYHQTFPTGVGRKVITITHIAFSAISANHETIINSRSLCSQPQRMWL